MDRLIAYMKEGGARVDAALETFLPRRKESPADLHEAMRYSVFAGGKRLRPLLCLMGGAVAGANDDACMPAACALEMVHTYSLIHDDLPAMDDDDYRRGKLSCHKAFGEAMAILAGDALLTLSFETVAANAPPEHTAELVSLLAVAAGSAGMVGGQVLDLEAEESGGATRKPSESSADIEIETPQEAVEAIHRRKTGALLTAAIEMGAASAGAEEGVRTALVSYGRKAGLAFQIKDDILDIESSAEVLGKSVGKDEASGKLTYPAVLGMDEAKRLLREAVMDAKAAVKPLGEKAILLRLLADFIAEREN